MRHDSKWVLYIVQCSDGSLYTGITVDIDRRLRQHNAGKASKYTRSRLPVTLRYLVSCNSHSEALKEELKVKKLARKQKDALILLSNSVSSYG